MKRIATKRLFLAVLTTLAAMALAGPARAAEIILLPAVIEIAPGESTTL